MADKNTNDQAPSINRGFIRRLWDPNDPMWLFLGGILGYFGQKFQHPANAVRTPEIKFSGTEDETLFEQLMVCLPELGNDVLGSGLTGEQIEENWRGLHQWCLNKDHLLAENLRKLLLGTKTEETVKLVDALSQAVSFANQAAQQANANNPLKGRILRYCVRIAKETETLITKNGGDKLLGYEKEVEALIKRRALIVPKHVQAAEWLKKAIVQSTVDLDLHQKLDDAEEALAKEQALQATWWHRYGIPLAFALIFLAAAGLQYCGKAATPVNQCLKTGNSSKEIPVWCELLPEPTQKEQK